MERYKTEDNASTKDIFDIEFHNNPRQTINEDQSISIDQYQISSCYNIIEQNEDKLSTIFAFNTLRMFLSRSPSPEPIFKPILPIHIGTLLNYTEFDQSKKDCLDILGRFLNYIKDLDESHVFFEVLIENSIFDHLHYVLLHLDDEETFNLCLFCIQSCQNIDMFRNSLFGSDIYERIKELKIQEETAHSNIAKLFVGALNSTYDDSVVAFFDSNIDFILNLAFMNDFPESNIIALEGLGTFFSEHPEKTSIFQSNEVISLLGDNLSNPQQPIRHAAGLLLQICSINPELLKKFYAFNIIECLFERFEWHDNEDILMSIHTLQNLAENGGEELCNQFQASIINKKDEIIGLNFKLKNEMIPFIIELIQHYDQEQIIELCEQFDIFEFLTDSFQFADEDSVRKTLDAFLTICTKYNDLIPIICEKVLSEEETLLNLQVNDQSTTEFIENAIIKLKGFLPKK